jgi:predicted Zn-dependent peptidase
MTAVAVGNLPVDELIEIVADGFTQTSLSTQEIDKNLLPQTFTPEPAFTEVVRREYVDETLQQARLVMVWRVPGMNELEQVYALDVLSVILGQGRVSRLVRDLREERQLVTHIGVSNMTQRHQGVFYISAQLPEENLAVVEDAIAQHIRKFQTELVAESELARIRTQVANRFIFGNEKPSDRTTLYGYYQSQLGDLAPALNYPSKIQSLNAVDLQVAAQQYLSPNAYGVVTIKPAKI